MKEKTSLKVMIKSIFMIFVLFIIKINAQELEVDNGNLLLKVDLARGGTISYLSQSGSNYNLVNIHDEGRYIQQSYYAGNRINRQGEGQSPSWSPWQWNPIQAGDSFGNRAQIKPTNKEMVYIGGGAGMAPLRAHIAQLFENDATQRKVSFWYGARSKQEIFYEDYFQNIAQKHPNFSFELALSNPLEEDEWTGHKGFIHQVAFENYLQNHPNPKTIEFYLCGPPMMIKASVKMLTELAVNKEQIVLDEF